ncbi:helicase associated domain protein [Faecalibacterium cf. prausnitzii KLE1255]|uniref:Helicase associated domain protein n=2 Tax=Faecalibacterium prausnitzii TaxID=853 RepID=E2ZF46_9FIRM|nr:Helicase associated domain protein [Faecalibacterium sp. BIOML-A3]EFQ08166.1 helicase associated domain protein [Faecalibacterium cf. prausnitzii KLE1255]
MRDTPLLRKGVNKVALRLFEHNEKAYRAAVRMMEQYGKAAIVHPTGTGKSYIAFKLIEDNPEKVVIWLSPSKYIFKTQLESLKRNDPDFPLANIHFYTYAKRMCCTQAQLDEIAAQKPAYIIFDESHRAGAECWGESTVALLKLCPDAKFLGLTATNIRYLDNNRDMAEELFDSRVASNMTLGEAVVMGILPAPKYVTTVYQYQKALAKYQARVDNLRTPGIQDVNQKYLDALRRALEQADGLDKVFADFKTDTGDRLKLLFCIDMLNEGVHVEGISGVILFRPTISPIIYKQQIARLDSIGMVWGNRNDRQWNQGYQEAKRYFEAHGDLRVPVNYVSPEGYALGKWVKRQRYTRQNPEKSCGALTEERMERLDAIGMIWNKMGS